MLVVGSFVFVACFAWFGLLGLGIVFPLIVLVLSFTWYNICLWFCCG